MAKTPAAIVDSLLTCFETSKRHEKPYRHWFLSHVLPMDVTDEITDLPYPAPDVGGMSGKRELHNATRKYFDVENQAKYPTVKAFCDAFQDPRVTGLIARHFGTRLNGTYLRVGTTYKF